MKYIYIDSLFFLSLFTDYLLCLITARICRICLRRRRYLAAALLGAAYSVSVFLPDLSFMASRWMELVSAALMGLIAFGGERRMFRCMAVFLAVSATFGGAIWALSLQTGALPVIDLRLLIGCFAVCYTVLSIIARSRSRAADRRTAAIELSLNGRHCCFTALIDSGSIEALGDGAYSAVSEQFEDVSSDITLTDESTLYWGGENDCYMRLD